MLLIAVAQGPSLIAVVIGILISDYQTRKLISQVDAIAARPALWQR